MSEAVPRQESTAKYRRAIRKPLTAKEQKFVWVSAGVTGGILYMLLVLWVLTRIY